MNSAVREYENINLKSFKKSNVGMFAPRYCKIDRYMSVLHGVQAKKFGIIHCG